MGRRAKQTCSICQRRTTLRVTVADGKGGRRCKEPCFASPVAPFTETPKSSVESFWDAAHAHFSAVAPSPVLPPAGTEESDFCRALRPVASPAVLVCGKAFVAPATGLHLHCEKDKDHEPPCALVGASPSGEIDTAELPPVLVSCDVDGCDTCPSPVSPAVEISDETPPVPTTVHFDHVAARLTDIFSHAEQIQRSVREASDTLSRASSTSYSAERTRRIRSRFTKLRRELACAILDKAVASASAADAQGKLATMRDLARIGERDAQEAGDDLRNAVGALVGLFRRLGGEGAPESVDDLISAVESLVTSLPGERPTISKSEARTLRFCPRRYYYEYEKGLSPVHGETVEQRWGSCLHRGLEGFEWCLPHSPELASEWACVCALSEGVGHDGRPYTAPTDPLMRAALRAVLRAYAAVWGAYDAERYSVIEVEAPFDLPIVAGNGEERKGRREGRIDLLARSVEDGRAWVIEHKTTGKPPGEDRFYHGLDVETQPALYFEAARARGLDPAGVIYNVVRRPEFDAPKPAPVLTKSGEPRRAPTRKCEACGGSGKFEDVPGADCAGCSGTGRVTREPQYSNPRYGENPEVYEGRLYEIITGDAAAWFSRRILTIEDWQIEETREDFHAAAEEVMWRRKTGHWPRVGDRYVCAAVRNPCPWLDVCGRRASVEDEMLFQLRRKPVNEKESQ